MVFEIKNAGRDESNRFSKLHLKLEVGQVLRVYTHHKPADYGWQVCDVLVQDAVTSSNSESPEGAPIRHRVPVGQHHIGTCSGTPWTPRVGDTVLIGFYQNDRPVILCTLPNQFTRPVCRNSANPDGSDVQAFNPPGTPDEGAVEVNGPDFTGGYYDWRMKLVQWLHIPQRNNLTFKDHPDGKDKARPVCFNYWDKTRDFFCIWECKKGKERPDCDQCAVHGPDWLECETETYGNYPAMNAWLKILSSDYDGQDDLPRRLKYHHPCGSVVCLDAHGEMEGRVWVENQVDHVPKGHFGLKPDGTFRASSHRDPETNQNDKALLSVYGDGEFSDDYGSISWELVDLVQMCFVRGYKDGTVKVQSPGQVIIKAQQITLDGDVCITGDLIDGSINGGT